MATVDIVINSKSYRIGCVDGEEDKIKKYAKQLESQVEDFAKNNKSFFRQLSNDKLFLLLLITLFEEMSEKEAKQLDKEPQANEVSNFAKEILKEEADDNPEDEEITEADNEDDCIDEESDINLSNLADLIEEVEIKVSKIEEALGRLESLTCRKS